MTRVVLTGWHEGLQKVALTNELRTAPGIGFAEAKAMVDNLLDGEPVVLAFSTEEAAEAFVTRLQSMGVNGEVM